MARTRGQRSRAAQASQVATRTDTGAAASIAEPIPTPQPATVPADLLRATRSPATGEIAPAPSVATVQQTQTGFPPAQGAPPVGPGFDLGAQSDNAISNGTAATTSMQPTPAPSVAQAFAVFASPKPVTAPAIADAVDITTIEPPIEKPIVAKAAPAKPVNPSRIWVQVATGRVRSALRFDWRRIARKAPEVLSEAKPFVADWGQTSRLLTGPYANAKDARAALNALAKAGVDAFQFTSDEGEEIQPLP